MDHMVKKIFFLVGPIHKELLEEVERTRLMYYQPNSEKFVRVVVQLGWKALEREGNWSFIALA